MTNKKTRNYTDEQLNAAIAQIKYGDLSLCKASYMYGIPKTTLSFRIKNPASSISTGTVTILSTFTELKLVEILNYYNMRILAHRYFSILKESTFLHACRCIEMYKSVSFRS